MNNNELLASAKLTSKGQLTIPKIVRNTMKLNEGDSVIFYIDNKNTIKITNQKNCNVKLKNDKKEIIS